VGVVPQDLQLLAFLQFPFEFVWSVEAVEQVVVENGCILVLFDVFNLSEILEACQDCVFQHRLMLSKELIKPFQQPQTGCLELEILRLRNEAVDPKRECLVQFLTFPLD